MWKVAATAVFRREVEIIARVYPNCQLIRKHGQNYSAVDIMRSVAPISFNENHQQVETANQMTKVHTETLS